MKLDFLDSGFEDAKAGGHYSFFRHVGGLDCPSTHSETAVRLMFFLLLTGISPLVFLNPLALEP